MTYSLRTFGGRQLYKKEILGCSYIFCFFQSCILVVWVREHLYECYSTLEKALRFCRIETPHQELKNLRGLNSLKKKRSFTLLPKFASRESLELSWFNIHWWFGVLHPKEATECEIAGAIFFQSSTQNWKIV